METETKQKALIIGGGPTTLETNRWANIDRDFTLTVSTAYLNPIIQQTNIDYFIISTNTDFTSNEFNKWYKNNPQCQFVIEKNHLWKTPKGMSDFTFNTPPVNISINESYRIGIIARAIMWLINTEQFSDIYFVGFDGYSTEGKGQHSFIQHVKQLDPKAAVNSYEQYYKSFQKYYNEVLKPSSNINFHNLGHGHPSNILTKIIE